MRQISVHRGGMLALIMIGLLAAAPAFADKPGWAGGGKGDKHGGKDRHERGGSQEWDHHDGGPQTMEGRFFDDRRRVVIHDYYAEQFRGGHCPPGLAKKHNGCLPPGQAKKWAMGRPLPPDVVYYDLPSPVVAQIGLPPAGYRYVRVANDILLIAVGTQMVVDAIRDLGGL